MPAKYDREAYSHDGHCDVKARSYSQPVSVCQSAHIRSHSTGLFTANGPHTPSQHALFARPRGTRRRLERVLHGPSPHTPGALRCVPSPRSPIAVQPVLTATYVPFQVAPQTARSLCPRTGRALRTTLSAFVQTARQSTALRPVSSTSARPVRYRNSRNSVRSLCVGSLVIA